MNLIKKTLMITLNLGLITTAQAEPGQHKINSCSRKAHKIYFKNIRILEEKSMNNEFKGALTQHINNQLQERLESCRANGSFDITAEE